MPKLTFEQLEALVDKLQKALVSVQGELKQFKTDYSIHQHANTDGTNALRKTITLDQDQVYVAGSIMVGSSQGYNSTNGRQYFGISSVGPQMQQTTTNQFPNYQLVIRHFPDDTDRLSILYGTGSPIVVSFANTSISTTAGGTTVTITGYNFATDSLINCWINIYDSSGVMQEGWKILSNTATVITIDGNWLNNTSGGFFEIYASSFLGDFMHLWKQLYLEKSSDGGIRFGPGLFTEGQQAALYVDEATGDLIYVPDNVALDQNISAAVISVSLGSGVTDTFTTADAKTVSVVDGIITSIV